jgi:adenylate kinase family enzyme
MIIIGYPGIGKSTLAREGHNSVRYIDLESSNFHIDDINRIDRDWADTYCKVAIDLSRQGYDVFMSSHKAVRNYLFRYITPNDYVVVCYPSLELKSEWLKKLRSRLQYDFHPNQEHKDKDARALMRAIDEYDRDIDDLHNSGYEERVIESMEYNLEELLFGPQPKEEEK